MHSNNEYHSDPPNRSGPRGPIGCAIVLVIFFALLVHLCSCSPKMIIYVNDIDQIDTLENGTLRITGPAVIKPPKKIKK